MPSADRAWSGRSHGGSFGHRLVALVARLGGIHLCYLFVLPPTLWLFIRLHERRRAAMRYWQHLRPDLGRWGCAFMAVRQFWSFARMLADRFLVYAAPGALSHVSLGYEVLRTGMAHPRGCVMLSAHLGNWELSGRFVTDYKLGPINLVMLQAEDPAVAAQVQAALGTKGITIIDLVDPFSASLAIAAALNRGETCGMLGDRTAGSADHTVAVPFCGAPARFPTGPFLAAAATGARIVPTFMLKTGWRSYTTIAFGPWPAPSGPRAQRRHQVVAAVARWARLVEALVRRHPLQWHNFYDFWKP